MISGIQSQIVTFKPAAVELHTILRWAKPYELDVYRVALTLTGNQDDADRVLVETVLRTWDQFVRHANLRPTLLEVLRIAVRESLQILRSHAGDLAGWIDEPDTRLGEVPVTLVEWEPDPQSLLAAKEWRKIRQLALDSLTPLDRATFLLRDVLRYSESETAELLERPAHAVQVRLLRARLRLREWLNPLCRVTGATAEPVEALAQV
jgi:RNA polymerase sigma-70 factor (ECF subfamily)